MKPSLDILQRWMQSVITHPGGIAGGLQSPTSQNCLEIGADELEQVINRSVQQTSTERLAIYANAYFQRLIECLASDFPIFRKLVGEEAFAGFAAAYLERYPSQSYTLGRLAENFARFLEATMPAAPSENQPESTWADFLVDLATLEQTLNAVFDGPGIEGKSIVTSADLLSLNQVQWPRARLQLVPCLRLLQLRFPINRYYTAAKRGEEDLHPFLTGETSWLAITRRDFIVRRLELSHAQFVLLTALQRGETVGDALSAAADIDQESPEVFAGKLRDWFREWTAAPLFAAVMLSC
jgi:hypothetical protein